MHKHLYFIHVFGCLLITLFPAGNLQKVSAQSLNSPDTGYFQCVITTEPPLFPYGNIEKWINRHLIYPPEAFEKDIEGKAFTLFTIDENGQVQDVRITRTTDSIFDKAARMVVQQMPVWIPCKDRGKPVKISYSLPVTFKLDEAILLFADKMPVFPDNQLVLWLKKEVSKCYESSGMESSVIGKTYVSFIIEKDGRVTYPEIARSSGFTDLDTIAIKIINKMPHWKPATYNDKPVRINYSVPIRFSPI